MGRNMREYIAEYMEKGALKYFEEQTRKEINFDLDTKKLKELYGKNYNGAYREIETYLLKMGFSHVQGSCYVSDDPISASTVQYYIEEYAKAHDWFAQSLKWVRVSMELPELKGIMNSIKEICESKEIEKAKEDRAILRNNGIGMGD